MSISRNLTTVTGAALASLAGAGSLAVLQTPMGVVAHADETHSQDTNINPSVGDNQPGNANVSTIDDAYKDIQGDTARDTNQSQHSSIGWEFQDPNQAAESWKTPDDTKVEPGTDNTQTDWNIATNTNGKSASDTSYDVTGDSSENKFNPGNVNLYAASAVSDKSASVRENWPAIERTNMAYDDFIAQYGTYWGPIYWGYYNQGSPIPVAAPVAGGVGGAYVVTNNNNNNNNSNNNNANNGLNNLAANLMSANGGSGVGGNGGTGNGVNGSQMNGSQQQQSGQNSSSSSSSSNSQTTVLPNGTVVNGLVGGYGFGGLGVLSNNNNNNNNNSSNNNALSNLSNLSNLANNGGAGNGDNSTVSPNNGKGQNEARQAQDQNNDNRQNQAQDQNNGNRQPAVDPGNAADDKDAKNKDVKGAPVATETQTTTEAASDDTGAGDDAGTAAVSTGSGSDLGDSGVVSAGSSALPQTGNLHVEKSSVLGAGLIAATLIGMGATKTRKKYN